MSLPSLIRKPWPAATVAGIAGILIASLPSGAADREPCAIPHSFVFGDRENQLRFEADTENGRESTLEQIDLLTKLKWSFAPLIPGLATGEVRIHLYDAQNSGFLAEYEDIDNTRFVRFFLACENDGRYNAIPGTISRLPDHLPQNQNSLQEGWEGYVGMTFRPEDTTPDATLKGDLFAFRR